MIVDDLVKRFALYDHPEINWHDLFKQMLDAGVIDETGFKISRPKVQVQYPPLHERFFCSLCHDTGKVGPEPYRMACPNCHNTTVRNKTNGPTPRE